MTSVSIRRIGLLFSGGPAPAANSVISAATLAFLNHGIEVIGFREGFRYLLEMDAPWKLQKDKHYWNLRYKDVTDIRNEPAILLKTSRANPGKLIRSREDLADRERSAPLRRVLNTLGTMGIDALVTIGGDDTLRTANCLYLARREWPDMPPIRFVHLPKTIDNDYFGIDWTFGFFSAADFAAREVRALAADAKSAPGWFILEIMGRKSGWLTYAAGIAGEATRMISVEDLQPHHLGEEGHLKLEVLADELIDLILDRERHDKNYGIVCVAEGLADRLTEHFKRHDPIGNPILGDVAICKQLAGLVEKRFQERTGRKIRIRAKQIGFETRCTPPSAFDVLLGSQLGLGAFRALVERCLDGCMVSVEDQLQIRYVPFAELIEPETLRTRVRFIPPDSDFFKLARALEFVPWR
jgi:6-phosphofructokinase 1